MTKMLFGPTNHTFFRSNPSFYSVDFNPTKFGLIDGVCRYLLAELRDLIRHMAPKAQKSIDEVNSTE
jgi:hypothetical protein